MFALKTVEQVATVTISVIRCDRVECDAEAPTGRYQDVPAGWWIVKHVTDERAEPLHFCSQDCARYGVERDGQP